MNDLDRTFDALFRTSIGFDRLVNRLSTTTQSYPPYDIVREDNDNFTVRVAAAGFTPDDIEVEQLDRILKIRGKDQKKEDKPTYIHRGIAKRTFNITLELAEHIDVIGAEFVNGLLQINLRRELPEYQKPRTIPVSSGNVLAHDPEDDLTG